MSDPLGSYSFIPWLQRGLATEITRVDGTSSADTNVPLPVAITLNQTLTATAPLALFGPGEIAGLDPNGVIRVSPKSDAYDAEPNYFALIEFDQADLPWRYTPARATTVDRLRPWLCLVTLREDELQSFDESGTDGKLAVATVKDAATLPLLDQSWAWAHVQVAGAGSTPPDSAALQSLLTTASERVISRLLSPRRLDANARYVACLVPAFERGRLAGLREPVTGDAMAPAWSAGQTNVRLPVYYRWRFGTGAGVDFEFLARQLKGRPIPQGVGTRPMDVSDPGSGLPKAADAALSLEGALLPPGFARQDPSGATPANFRTKLADLLNRPADLLSAAGGTRTVAPPLYGRWYALKERLSIAAGAQPPWFNELNAETRFRVPAGLGTQVVQAEQRQLMASAWDQVKGIREANERLRQTQLAREAAQQVFARHIVGDGTDDAHVFNITSLLHAKVRGSPTTIAALTASSPIARGTMQAVFRRIARPLGPLGRRIGYAANPARANAIASRMNSGAIGVKPPALPKNIVSPGTAGAPTIPQAAPSPSTTVGRGLWFLTILVAIAAAVLGFMGLWVGAVIALIAAAVAAFSAWSVSRSEAQAASESAASETARVERLREFGAGRLTADSLRAAVAAPGFVPRAEARLAGPAPAASPAAGPTAAAAAQAIDRFRTASMALLEKTATPPIRPPDLIPISINDLSKKLIAQLDPRLTIVAGVRDRLRLPPTASQPGGDPVEPVMAAPEFPQPMYGPLAALSSEWLLPGLDKVPQNTTSLLVTNQKGFVEPYMVGLNQEMARELQWNEYPTDLRGSYFRQFWDVAMSTSDQSAAVVESLKDIDPLPQWNGNELGENRPAPPASGEYLVLLVRAELLRRYPHTIVYACKAKGGASGRELTDEDKLPLFSGRLDPDVTFFGFDLTAADAKGVDDTKSPNQGWFFVLQEQVSEPRFGLDIADGPLGGAPASWSDLGWGNVAGSDADLTAITYLDLDAQLPDTRSVTNTGGASWHADAGLGTTGSKSSHLAYITLQQPMRVAIHGSDMIT